MRTAITFLLAIASASTAHTHPHSSECNSTSVASPAASPAATADANAQLLRELLSAPTALERARLLLVDGETLRTGDELEKLIVFDFDGLQPASGALGGSSKAADLTTYPFSAGLDVSMTVVSLSPCGINTPHIHPRAVEFLILVEGSNVRFGSVLENGLVRPGENQEIAGKLNRLQATVFPQGSMHWQFNDACENALLVAALNSGKPGTSQMAQNLFSLNAAVLNATLGAPSTIGGKGIEDFKSSIPINLARDVHSCLTRCGL